MVYLQPPRPFRPHMTLKKLLAPTWRRKLFGARQGLPRLDQAPDQQHSNPLRRGTRYTDRCNLVHFPLFQAGFPTSPWEKVARVIGADSVSPYSVTWECSSIIIYVNSYSTNVFRGTVVRSWFLGYPRGHPRASALPGGTYSVYLWFIQSTLTSW